MRYKCEDEPPFKSKNEFIIIDFFFIFWCNFLDKTNFQKYWKFYENRVSGSIDNLWLWDFLKYEQMNQ